MKKLLTSFITLLSITCLSGCGEVPFPISQIDNSSEPISENNSSEDNSSSSNSEVNLIGDIKLLKSASEDHSRGSYDDRNSEGYKLFKKAMKGFALRLNESFISRYLNDKDNITISPLSIELCVGLAIRCSSGVTREELLNLFDLDYETFNKYYKIYFNDLYRDVVNEYGQTVGQVLFTNSIWVDDDAELVDETLDDLAKDYYCYSYQADFDGRNDETNKAIEAFIREKTKGLINPQLDLSEDTLFMLMNTLYLKDIWNETGSKLSYSKDEKHKFINSDNSISSKQLLLGNYCEGKALDEKDYTAFKAHTEGSMNLYFIQPKEGKTLSEVFTTDNINYVTNSSNYVYQDSKKLERYHTRCVFPEYEGKADIDLKEIFREDYGVETLFNGDCDFSSVSDKQQVYCSEFRHIAKLKVDKTGIEGAAVTYMAMEKTSAEVLIYKDVYLDYLVDHQFGYVLTYNDNIMFTGATNNIDK